MLDRFHLRNHVDMWCHENFSPYRAGFTLPEKVADEICESVFAWMCGFAKTLCRMKYPRFDVLLLDLCDLHNARLNYGFCGHLPLKKAPQGEATTICVEENPDSLLDVGESSDELDELLSDGMDD